MSEAIDALRTRLDEFMLDDPRASLPFSARLARENGWTQRFTRRVIEELVAPHLRLSRRRRV